MEKAFIRNVMCGNGEEVVVPAELGGRKVKRIKAKAFYQIPQLKTLAISEGIEKVESRFVAECSGLEKIVFPNTVELVSAGIPGFVGGNDGLYSCFPLVSLKEIVVDEESPYLVVIDDILYNKDCTELIACLPKAEKEIVKIPDGVEKILSGAFSYNASVKKITLPDSVVSIGYWAFQRCSSLKEINIPPHCRHIGQFAFSDTKIREIKIPAGVQDAIMSAAFWKAPIEKIEVEEGNPYYHVKDGALYADCILLLYEVKSKREELKILDNTTRICQGAFTGAENLKKIELGTSVTQIDYDAFWDCRSLEILEAGKSKLTEIKKNTFMDCVNLISVNLPDSVVSIEEEAFVQCVFLNEISLPKGLKRIGERSFYNCQYLQAVEIPTSVTVIEKDAFGGVGALKNIFFRGSEEQWNSIEKNENDFHAVKIHFNSAMCQHEWEDEIRINEYPTCVRTGSGAIYCKKCDCKKRNSEVILPLSDNHEWAEVETIREATCTEPGEKSYVCMVCAKKKTEKIDKTVSTGHSWDSCRILKKASIYSEGKKQYICSVCGSTREEIIEKCIPSILIAPKKITVAVGKSVTAPQVTYQRGDLIIRWKSADPSIAYVNRKREIIGKKAGKTTITVTLRSKKTAKFTVVVAKKIPTTSIKADKRSLQLKKGKSCQLKVTVKPLNTSDTMSFKSSNPKVVTVSSKGKLKAKKKGKATITITSGKKKVTCKVTVK